MIHLTLNQISAYIDGELPEASVELVRLHLSSCLECTERFGHIEEQEGALARLLVNEPGDPFFERFAERVLGPEPRKKAEPAPAAVDAPRAAAEPPRPKAVDPSTRAGPRKGGAARNLLPAAGLLIVLSAAAVIAVRPRVPRLSLTPADRRVPPATAPDPRPPQAPASPSDAAPPPATGGSDLLERAAARSSEAEKAGTPEAMDAAAAAWEEALPGLEKNADELAAGRREVASARYAAWSKSPTPERRDAAMLAVRAYLLSAPAGPDRDRAWTWLAELKR